MNSTRESGFGYDEHAVVLDLSATLSAISALASRMTPESVSFAACCAISWPNSSGSGVVDEYEVEQSVHQHAPGLRTGGSRCKLSLYAAGR